MTDRGYLSHLDENSVVFGDVCDSCGERQVLGHSRGLKKLQDVGGDWLLCSACHPQFDEVSDEE